MPCTRRKGRNFVSLSIAPLWSRSIMLRKLAISAATTSGSFSGAAVGGTMGELLAGARLERQRGARPCVSTGGCMHSPDGEESQAASCRRQEQAAGGRQQEQAAGGRQQAAGQDPAKKELHILASDVVLR